MVRGAALNVFINCPFDREYQPIFESIIFTIYACGYRARCALEHNDSGDIRLDKLVDLVRQSQIGIHDLSRVKSKTLKSLPRFNMPFELGLWYGTKRFGNVSQQKKRTLILVEKKYKMPIYLSDLGGNDPKAHYNSAKKTITYVRGFLQRSPRGKQLPGAHHIHTLFKSFSSALPEIAREAKLRLNETDSLKHFPDYQLFVVEFVMANRHKLVP